MIQYRRQTLITAFSLLEKIVVYKNKRSCFLWVRRLARQPFPRVPLKFNECDSVISNTKQGNFKRPLHKEICLNISAKKFPYVPLYYYIHGVHLDKPSEGYALTEAKHRFSGKRRALSNPLKGISVQIIFCSQRIDLKRENSVKIRTL